MPKKQSLEIEDMYYSRNPHRDQDIICMKIKGLDTIILLKDTKNNRFLLREFCKTGDGWDACTEAGNARKRAYQKEFGNIEQAFFEEHLNDLNNEAEDELNYNF